MLCIFVNELCDKFITVRRVETQKKRGFGNALVECRTAIITPEALEAESHRETALQLTGQQKQ